MPDLFGGGGERERRHNGTVKDDVADIVERKFRVGPLMQSQLGRYWGLITSFVAIRRTVHDH